MSNSSTPTHSVATEITHLLTILTDSHSTYLQSLASIYKLNKILFSLEYASILKLASLLSKNDIFMEKMMDMAMEGRPCVYQVVRLLSIVAMDPYGRKRLLALDFLSILFALLKANQYLVQSECFLTLQTMITHKDTDFLNEMGAHVGRGGIEMMIRWMKEGNEEVQMVARRVLAYVKMSPEGSALLEKYYPQRDEDR